MLTMSEQSMTIEMSDGIRLVIRQYEPETGCASRSILLVHGATEHGQRYRHVADYFATRNWNVIVPDLRGHGESEGRDTHIRHFREYVDDLNRIRSHFALSPKSTVLMGHSMGALVSIRYLQTFIKHFDHAVLMSPLLGVRVHVPIWTEALGRLVSLIAPQTRFRSRVDSRETCRDPEKLRLRSADALMRHSVTAGWYFAVKAAIHTAWENIDRFQTPVLMLQGSGDRIVDPEKTREWFNTIPVIDKTLEIFENHLHELHNETDWETTIGLVGDWLECV